MVMSELSVIAAATWGKVYVTNASFSWSCILYMTSFYHTKMHRKSHIRIRSYISYNTSIMSVAINDSKLNMYMYPNYLSHSISTSTVYHSYVYRSRVRKMSMNF